MSLLAHHHPLIPKEHFKEQATPCGIQHRPLSVIQEEGSPSPKITYTDFRKSALSRVFLRASVSPKPKLKGVIFMNTHAKQLLNVLRAAEEFGGSEQPIMRTRVQSSACQYVRLEVLSFKKGRHAILGFEKSGSCWWIAVRGSLAEAICEAISEGSLSTGNVQVLQELKKAS